MINKEYRVVSIVIVEYIIDIFVFSLFVFYYLNYINVFYYYTKAILLDNLDNLLQNFDLRRVLVITLINIYSINILIDQFLIKVKSNSSDVFSRVSSQIKYGIAIFVFFIIFVVLILLDSLVVSYNINIVLSCLDSNEFDQFKFLFV